MKLPLFIITGASGAGKSTIVPFLWRLLPTCDVFDMDIILDETDWRRSHRNWFRIAESLAEQGRCTVLCGTVIPEHLAGYKEIEAFSTVYFLNLHCDDTLRETRLAARHWPADLIENHRNFASWLLTNAGIAFNPPLETVDTGMNAPDIVATHIQQWVVSRLPQSEREDFLTDGVKNINRKLFRLVGTCAAGKSTVIPILKRLLPMCAVFDGDIIEKDATEWKTCQHNMMRIAKSLVEQGRYVLVCGLLIPEHLHDYEEMNAFQSICYFDLHCDDATRHERLQARGMPDDFIQGHHEFARWLLANANTAFDPPMEVLDATRLTPEESAAIIEQWVFAHIRSDHL